MSIQHEKNKQITQNQVDELLTHDTRVATNMEKVKTGYDANYYSMEKTMQDRQLIDDLLKLPESTTLQLSDEQKYRLKTIQSRNISHILLNQNSFTGDSDEMKKAKKYVQALEQLMSQPLQKDTMNQSIADLETAYLEAIAACKYYCDHKDPSFESGRDRKQAVADSLERLRAESAQLSEAKRLLESGQLTEDVTSVQDLLVAAQKSMAVNELESAGRRQKKTGLEALTFDSFARMIGTHNRGQVELDGNGLKMINNGKFSLSNGVASVENRLLRERFLKIVMQELGEKYALSMYERIRNTLGLDQAADRMLPLSRQQIRDIVTLVNDQTSVVDRVLSKGKETFGAEHRFALEVDQMIGGQVENYERARTTAAQEQILKKEIQTILIKAKKDGMDVPELTKHQMDNLVRGNISRLRDNIYQAVNGTYRAMCNLNGGEAVDYYKLAGNQTVLNQIAAYTIIQMTAGTETGRRIAELDLHRFIKDTAFEFSGKKELEKDFSRIYVGNLAVRGAMGLEGAVENRLPKNKTWQKDPHKVKRGMDGLAKLCDAMRKISNYEEKAFFQGLTEEQAADLQKIGNQVVELLSGESHGDLSFVAKELKGTRFAEGFKEAEALVGEKDQSQLLGSIESIVKATKIRPKNKPEDPRPINQNTDPTYQDGVSADLSALSKEARAVAKVLLLQTTPASLIQKGDSNEVVENILALRAALRAFPEGEAYEENLNLAGVNLRLEQSKGGMLQMKLDGQTIPVPFDIRMLVYHMDMEMIEGKKETGQSGIDLYGEEYARQIFKELKPDSTDVAQIRHVRNVCLKLMAVKTGMKSPAFDNTSTEDLYLLTQEVLKGNATKRTVEDFIEEHQMQNQNLINDQETLEILKKAKLQIDCIPEKVKLAPEKVEEKDALKWEKKEEQVRDLLADLIYSEETWKTDELVNTPGERIRKTLLNHMEAVLTLIFEPQVFEQIFEKMNPLRFDGQEEGPNLQAQLKNMLDTMLQSEGLHQLTQNPIIGKMILRKVLPLLLGDNDEDLEKEYHKSIKKMISLVFTAQNVFGEDQEEEEEKDEAPKTEQQKLEERKQKKEEQLQQILDMLKEVRTMLQVSLPQVDQKISEVVQENLTEIQDMINTQVKAVFGKDNAEDQGPKEEPKTLEQMMEQITIGDKGMGGFIQNVFAGYFVNIPDIDRRSMLASALRNAKPQRTLHKLHPLKPLKELKKIHELIELTEELKKIPDDLTDEQKDTWLQSIKQVEEENASLAKENEQNEKENEQIRKENQQIEAENQKLIEENARLEAENEPIRQELQANREKIMGNYLSGFLKGAGPLFQKMLQGMPDKMMPPMLRQALEDMKSNLAPIPQEVVQARLLAIVNGSKGQITKIEVTKAMGAASVAQAFFCKLYGPNLPKEGKDVVIKLLRPDVRNRMMREKAFMLQAAKDTDEGMEATYRGQLEKIEEEFDLRIEADHIQEGDVYNDGVKTVQSVKIAQLVAPTANTLVMEKAPGTTLDRYIKACHEEMKQIMAPFEVTDAQGHTETVINQGNYLQYAKQREKLVQLMRQMEKRRGYLIELSEKWVDEGVFGREDGGFYHGDLHAGNIMIDDKGLTVIDFGNATRLNHEQQKSIIRMVMAACTGEAKDFRHEYHKLLSDKFEDTYQKNKDKLLEELDRVLHMESFEQAGMRICVALSIAQKFGLELPPEVSNFSNCQIRLQNSVDSMNAQISEIEEKIRKLDDMHILDMNGYESIGSYHVSCNKATKIDDKIRLKTINDELNGLIMKRQQVLVAVRGKSETERKAFDEKMNLEEIKKGIQENLDYFHSCITENGQSKEERLNDFYSKKQAMFDHIKQMRFLYDTEEIPRYHQICREMRECLEKPFENVDRFDKLCEELLRCKNMNTYEKRLEMLRKAQDDDKTPKEELARLEQEFLQIHEKLFNLSVIRKDAFGKHVNDVIVSLYEDAQMMVDNEFRTLLAQEDQQTKELKEAYEQMMEKVAQYRAQLNEDIREFEQTLEESLHMDINQEKVLAAVRGKSAEERTNFDKTMPIPEIFVKIQNAQKTLTELAGEPESEERVTKLRGCVQQLYNVVRTMEHYGNPDEIPLVETIGKKISSFATIGLHPLTVEEYFTICNDMLAIKSMHDYNDSLTKLRKAQDDDKTPPEELKRLELEWLGNYQKFYRNHHTRKYRSMKSSVHRQLTQKSKELFDSAKKEVEHLFSDPDRRGSELQEKFEKMMRTLEASEMDDELEEKKDQFKKLYLKVVCEHFKQIAYTLKADISTEDQPNFLKAMGSVIGQRILDVGSKVGWWFSFRYGFKGLTEITEQLT